MSRSPILMSSSSSFSLFTLCLVLIAFTRISTSQAAKYGDTVKVDGLRIPIWGALFTTDEDPAIILAACQNDVSLLFPNMADYVDCYDIQDDTDRILPSYRAKIAQIAQSPPVRLTVGILPFMRNGTIGIPPSIKLLEDEIRTFIKNGKNITIFDTTTNTFITNPSTIAQRMNTTKPGDKDALRIFDKIPHFLHSTGIKNDIGISSKQTQIEQILSLVELKQDTLVYCAGAIPNEYVLECPNDDRYYAGQIGLGVAVTIAVFMLIFVASCTYGIWNKHEQQRKRNNRRNVKKDKQKLILGDHNTDFKQQRLAVWSPRLTYPWVISTYAVIAILFIPIGWYVIFQQLDLVDVSVRYDNLDTSCPINTNTDPFATPTATCTVSIPIPRDMFPPVYVYYQVTNMYQNHRRYINSVGFKQMRNDGRAYADCAPKQTFQTSGLRHTNTSILATMQSTFASENDKKLYPCGLIAQSFFTDSFTQPCILTSDIAGCNALQWERTGIAWKSDLDRRFKENFNPNDETRRNAYRGYNMPSVENEDFVVWMRASAMPTFTKLYAKIYTKLNKGEILKLQVNNNYDVTSFSGEKSIVLSTVSRIGGRNIFMGVAYILFGFLSMIMAIVFYVRYRLNRADKED